MNTMKIQNYVVDCARDAANMAFRYASAVPEEKLDWSPKGEGGEGRSVLSMCRELAWTPEWACAAMNPQPQDWSEEQREAARQLEQNWKTVDDCHAQFNERFKKWEETVLALSDEDLSKTKWLPYDGGRDFTYLEMLDYVRWNSTYHLGQIAYIQILYGDKEIYW